MMKWNTKKYKFKKITLLDTINKVQKLGKPMQSFTAQSGINQGESLLTKFNGSSQYLANADDVILPLQLMKATVLAESYYFLSTFITFYQLQRCLLTEAR